MSKRDPKTGKFLPIDLGKWAPTGELYLYSGRIHSFECVNRFWASGKGKEKRRYLYGIVHTFCFDKSWKYYQFDPTINGPKLVLGNGANCEYDLAHFARYAKPVSCETLEPLT
jgi:hypothetical protein